MDEYYKKAVTNYSEAIAKDSLEKGRIKISSDKPFQWASGYFMPIYNDNRQILIDPLMRSNVKSAFKALIYYYGLEEQIDTIAGTSTAGISPATSLADYLKKPLIYVREKPKDHGLKNRIEGIAEDQNLNKKKIILIEDLISTGGSSASAVQAIRDADGLIDWCLSIFNYGFEDAKDMFNGKVSYNNKGDQLSTQCNTASIITYDLLMDIALKNNYLTKDQLKTLEEWRIEPFLWGEKRGYPNVEKK